MACNLEGIVKDFNSQRNQAIELMKLIFISISLDLNIFTTLLFKKLLNLIIFYDAN